MTHLIKICAIVTAACVALPLESLAETAAATKPITHEALWMMKRVGAPVVSPDGKWVVYPVLEPSYDADKAVSDLWLVPVDGSRAAAPHHQYQGPGNRCRLVRRQQQHRIFDQA